MASDQSNITEAPSEVGNRRRRRVALVLTCLFVLIVLLALDGVWAARGAQRNLYAARDDLRAGADSLIAGHPDQAAALFAAARSQADHAAQIRFHPAVALVRFVPHLGNNVSAVLDLSKAASMAADAGESLAGAASKLGWSGTGVPGISNGLGATITALPQATPQLQQASDTLTHAESVLAGINTQGLVGRVRDAVATARSTLASQSSVLRSAVDVAQLLPGVLADGRRYLFIVQNLDDPRGTGGFMGYFGFLKASQGHLKLTKLFPADDARVPGPITAPADFKARYGRFDAMRSLTDTNFCPDLPTTAKVVLQIAAQRGWGKFDGIFMVDSVSLKNLLDATGPVNVPGLSDPLSAANAIQVLGHDVFLSPLNHSNRVQAAAGLAVWQAVQTRSYSAKALATALSSSVAQRHLQIYSTNPSEEALIGKLGASGETTLGQNPLAVVWEGITGNKAVYFAERSVAQTVSLDANGTATVTTTLHVINNAPETPPSLLLGYPGSGYKIGTVGLMTSIYLPQTIEGFPHFKASGGTISDIEHEFGRPVGFGYMEMRPGRQFTWSMTYIVPNAVTETNGVPNGTKEYRVDYLPQPMLFPMPISVTITLPAAARVSGTSPDVDVSGTTITYTGSPTTSQSIWVHFS